MSDGIYSIANGLLRSGQNNGPRYLGVQPELEVKYTSNPHLYHKGIFVYFRAGEFLEQTSDRSDINYLGTMLTYRL